MNILEIIFTTILFILSFLLLFYLKIIILQILYDKYVFEATRHSTCNNESIAGGIVTAMCIKLVYNGTLVPVFYNVTYPTPS